MNKVLSENLYKALKEVKITKIYQSLPILNYARLEFKDGWLIVTTSDLENTYTAKCSCIMEEEYSTCVPMVHEITGYFTVNSRKKSTRKFYPFLDFLKVCAEYKDVLELSFNPKVQILTVKVQGERSITEFKCLDAVEFPAV